MSKICGKIEKNQIRIVELLNQNIDYRYQLNLEKAKTFEIIENHGKKVKVAVFPQNFQDEDSKEVVIIQRKMPVEVDGVKCDEFANPLKYFTINDIP